MSNKQTALNFLLTELDIAKIISKEKLIMAAEIVRQAKEMHKQEIMNACDRFANSIDFTIEDLIELKNSKV